LVKTKSVRGSRARDVVRVWATTIVRRSTAFFINRHGPAPKLAEGALNLMNSPQSAGLASNASASTDRSLG
jgi:hypothetical protein